MAYTNALPAIAISTLALQAQTALRLGHVTASDTVLSTIDARINEVYYAIFRFEEGLAVMLEGPFACAPAAVTAGADRERLQAVGSGCRFAEAFPAQLRLRLQGLHPDLLPAAQDLLPLALAAYARGEIQQPQQVQPLYVRDEISWKKLADQGKAV